MTIEKRCREIKREEDRMKRTTRRHLVNQQLKKDIDQELRQCAALGRGFDLLLGGTK